ncbi:MAG: DNA starvation/stationary phase protection protein Dps [Chloroflexota bacterium]|nr:DNA starvation/stationary phase protection protein Dps [Chloroflexota bacterium]
MATKTATKNGAKVDGKANGTARNSNRSGAVRTFATSVEIPAENRERLIEQLNEHLADAFDLMSQSKQAHWNVKGRDFYQLHELFDEIAAEAAEWVDELAERVTALGGYATGTVRMAAASSRLPEFPTDITEGMEYVRALADGLATFSNLAREGIDRAEEQEDANTADLLTDLSREADKHLYFLEAHLQA